MAADTGINVFRLVPEADAQRRLRFSKRRSVQRCRRIAERCLDLSAGEVAHRVGLLFGGPRNAGHPFPNATSSIPPRARVADALNRGFVLGPQHVAPIVDALTKRPDLRARIVEEGRRLMAEGVRVFDKLVRLDSGDVDWLADPRSGRRLWPQVPMDEGDAVRATRAADGSIVTDVKYVWELNRHQFLAPLALTAHATSDQALLARVTGLVDNWIRDNPPGHGVNWSSVLEVGVRAISWLWTLPLVIDTPALDDERAQRWFASFRNHFEFLCSHLSIYTDRSNHLIGEATSIWLLASVFPELPDAELQAARALDVLAVEIERQVTADGVSCEQAVGYHCFVLDFYLQLVGVAHRQEHTLPPVVESRVFAMLTFLHRLLGTAGALPNIGDADDGIGIPMPWPVTPRERAEALVSVGVPLLHADSAAASNVVLGVLRGEGATTVRAAPSLRRGTSALLREGGYCFLEAATSRGEPRQLVFDVGGLGYLPNAAHEHADALSILVRVGETLVLADPGTGSYTGSATVRNVFRGTAAHNTITIDDLDQADVLDTFKWINCFRTDVLYADLGAHLDHVVAAHDGYDRMRDRMRHVREILFVRPDYWIIADRLVGRGSHSVTRRFHCAPGFAVEPTGPSTFDLRSGDTPDGLRMVFPQLGRDRTVATAEASPWSPGYGRWGTSVCLTLRDSVKGHALFLTLIVPLRHGQAGAMVEVAATAFDACASGQEAGNVVCRIHTGGRNDVLARTLDGRLSFAADIAGEHLVRTLGVTI